MMKYFISLILSGQFNAAAKMEKNFSAEDIYENIMEAAYDTESNLFYTYYLNKLIKDENADDHYRASLILSQVLNFVDGTYDLAAYHAKRAMILDDANLKYKEYYLLFYKHPDESLGISYEEFRLCAQQLLKFEPNNPSAKGVILDIK